jgi:hypothetical protein
MRRDYGFPVIGLLYCYDRSALACDPADARRVPLDDVSAHEAAFQEGWVGVRVEPDGTVVYQRRSRREPDR